MLHLVCLSYIDLFQFLPEYKTDLIVVAISPVRSLLYISSNYIALNLDVFSIFEHIARMDDDADAKMILMAPPAENWKRPPGRPRITWLNISQWDMRAYNL